MKIYVGCSLTHAPQGFRIKAEALKIVLREVGHEVFDFVGLEKGTPQDVYRWDIHRCVALCDLFIAICDFPAIGLGYELGVAVEKYGKKVLAVAHKDTKLTRLVLGIDHPEFNFRTYEELGEVVGFVAEMTPRQPVQQEFNWGIAIAA